MFMVVKTKPTIKSRIPVKNKAKTTVKLKEKSRPAAGSKKSVTSGKEDFARLAEDIISNVGVGIYVLQQGKFVYVSSLYKKLSGYLDKELIGLKSLAEGDAAGALEREATTKFTPSADDIITESTMMILIGKLGDIERIQALSKR